MENKQMFVNLTSGYTEIAYTGNYIFGYRFNKSVYMTITNHSILESILSLDVASRGCGYALRFCPNAEKKAILMSENFICLASEADFDEMVKNSKYNKGEIFEKLVTEYFGQVWEKDNVPFTEAGDIEVNDIAYQIKYEKATFCNEKSLASLRAKAC